MGKKAESVEPEINDAMRALHQAARGPDERWIAARDRAGKLLASAMSEEMVCFHLGSCDPKRTCDEGRARFLVLVLARDLAPAAAERSSVEAWGRLQGRIIKGFSHCGSIRVRVQTLMRAPMADRWTYRPARASREEREDE